MLILSTERCFSSTIFSITHAINAVDIETAVCLVYKITAAPSYTTTMKNKNLFSGSGWNIMFWRVFMFVWTIRACAGDLMFPL